MRLYLDEHVPRAVAEGLRRRGIDVLTAQEDGFSGMPDLSLLDRARDLGCVIYTQDDDFLAEAKRRQALGIAFAGVIYCHQLTLTIGRQVVELEIIANCSEPSEHADRVIYLPL